MTEVDMVDLTTDVRVKCDGVTVRELVFHGIHVMLGYLKDLEGTKSVEVEMVVEVVLCAHLR